MGIMDVLASAILATEIIKHFFNYKQFCFQIHFFNFIISYYLDLLLYVLANNIDKYIK